MEDKKFDTKILKKERTRAGLSFGKFSEALKKHVPKANKTVCWQWETYNRVPSTRYLIAISNVFNKPMDYFFK